MCEGDVCRREMCVGGWYVYKGDVCVYLSRFSQAVSEGSV